MAVEELKQRIQILDVPVDIIPEENLEAIISRLTEDGENHQIMFLSTWDLMRARRNSNYGACVRKASLIIPVSRSLVRAASFLKRDALFRYMPFDLVIRILGILEKQGKSVYLIGHKPRGLQVISGNLRTSFPGLSQVGRYAGFFKADLEQNILLAIKKASPSLLLAGDGVPGRDLWIDKHRKMFNPGIYLWSSECFAIFAGKKERTNRKQWEKGMDTFPAALVKPWRFLRGFVYLYYGLLLLLHRIRKN